MNLALTILFLWLGFALLFVAFHPLSLESAKGSPRDILRSLQNTVAGNTPVPTLNGFTGPIVGGIEQGVQGALGNQSQPQ